MNSYVIKNSTSQALFTHWMKYPAVVHPLEWPAEIFDKNREIGPIKGDATGECLANDLVGNRHVGDHNDGAVLFLVAALDRQCAAQRHEFRIFFDIRDQVEHVRRGVADTALR